MTQAETFIQYCVERKGKLGNGNPHWYRTFFTEPSSNTDVTDNWLIQIREMIKDREDEYRIITFARTTVTVQMNHAVHDLKMYTPSHPDDY